MVHRLGAAAHALPFIPIPTPEPFGTCRTRTLAALSQALLYASKDPQSSEKELVVAEYVYRIFCGS